MRLWERRPDDADFLELTAGLGDAPWAPTLAERPPALAPEVSEVLQEASTLPLVPMAVPLEDGGVVGIVGQRGPALALARSLLCQAAVHHGPADVLVSVVVDPRHEADWDWAKWLPHTRNLAGAGGARWLAASPEDSEPLLQALLEGQRKAVTLVVVDSDTLTEGRRSPARSLLRGEGGPVAGIIVASTESRLPAVCDTVIDVRDADGDAVLRRPELGQVSGNFLLAGLSEPTARWCARVLARFEDPELDVVGAGLPDRVSLLPLLELDRVEPDAVAKAWRQAGPDPGAATPIGVGEDGIFDVDLVHDGPHGLVAGTTGSGKSELLRSMVAGLAVRTDTDHLNFVLVDYKGGAAFDKCSQLPHAVGLVTDLDEQLAERALRCLEAELRHRERILRTAGDLSAYLRAGRGDPLPRLLVIIDEFATLAAELPDFMSSLVGIAQRGRSLGVHLILATQRPSGAVNENIRANTNLRIALRMQDASDSSEVIGRPDAATISRARPGRAYVRLGPGEVVPIQTALVTGSTGGAVTAYVETTPFRFGPFSTSSARQGSEAGGDQPVSDLDRIVQAVVGAHSAERLAPPRRPWPDPLPAAIDLEALSELSGPRVTTTTVLFALADDPDAQAQYPTGWDLASGNLVLYGIGGSGTTTALATLAVAIGRTWAPDRVHLYVLDLGAGQLAALERLPHAGAVVGANDRERQTRLVRHLRAELNRRRGGRPGAAADPRIVVLLDNVAGFLAAFDDPAGMEVIDDFTRVFAEGPDVGIHFAMSADRSGAVPGSLAALTPNKWLFRLADVHDYGTFGLSRRDVPAPAPGRAVVAVTSQVVQVALPDPTLERAVADIEARYGPQSRSAAPIGVLPERVELPTIAAAASLDGRPWIVPVGIGDHDLAPAGLSLFEGEHVLVAGPGRAGKTTALWTIAEAVKRARPDVRVLGIVPPRSPLRACPHLDQAVSPGEAGPPLASVTDQPTLVVVDDADAVEDSDGAIAGLLARRLPDVHVVASGRPDVLRSLYGHWTQTVRRSKLGVLLNPNLDFDGDLLSSPLPRRQRVAPNPGRGYLVNNGDVQLVQLAQPARPRRSATRRRRTG